MMKCIPLVRRLRAPITAAAAAEKMTAAGHSTKSALVAAQFEGPGEHGRPLETMQGEDADHVGTDTEKRSVSQADHAPKPSIRSRLTAARA